MSTIISGPRLAVNLRSPLAPDLGRRWVPEIPCALLSEDRNRKNTFSFFPLAFFLWLVLFALTACSGGGGGGSSGGGSSTAPVATSASLSTTENTPANGVLQSTDPSGNTLTFRIVRNASLGNVVITDTATGAYTYTPITNINGTDSFDFVANDGAHDSNVATITITIIANRPPVAMDDAYTVPHSGATLSIPAPGVLANDSDSDGNPITAVQFTQPAHGTLSPSAAGSFTYTHNGDTATTDSFTYRANDGRLNSTSTATVTLTINRPPVAANACLSTPKNTPLNGTLTATDETLSQPVSFSLLSDPVGPNKGTVTVNANGSFTYTPGANFQGLDKFMFRATDKYGLTSDAVVSVLIDGAVRIMTMGDSITQGVWFGTSEKPGGYPASSCDTDGSCPLRSQRVGYRKKLVTDLEALSPNYAVDMVGGLTDGSAVLPSFDDQHESHPGDCAGPVPGVSWCTSSDLYNSSLTRNLSDNVVSWLNNNPADIILLHIGTNGLDAAIPNVESANAAAVDTLLNNISSWAQSKYPVTVFVARIIPAVDGSLPVNTFNNDVAALTPTRPNVRVIMVDEQTGAGINYAIDNSSTCLNTGVCSGGDMAANLHPNPAGYGKMADKWKADLISSGVLPSCP